MQTYKNRNNIEDSNDGNYSMSSISSMSTSSCNTTDDELLDQYAGALNLETPSTLAEAHIELDQLAGKFQSGSPTAVPGFDYNDHIGKKEATSTEGSEFANGAIATRRTLKLQKDKLQRTQLYTYDILTDEQDATTTTSRTTLGQRSNKSILTDGTGTTAHHANGKAALMQKKYRRKDKKGNHYTYGEVAIPQSIEMASDGENGTRSECGLLSPTALAILKIKQLRGEPTNGELEVKNSVINKTLNFGVESGKMSSALGFMQSMFDCCHVDEVIDEDAPTLQYRG